MDKVQLSVYTHLGKGKVVHTFPDGTVAVEFEHGGGAVLTKGQVFCPPDHPRPARRLSAAA